MATMLLGSLSGISLADWPASDLTDPDSSQLIVLHEVSIAEIGLDDCPRGDPSDGSHGNGHCCGAVCAALLSEANSTISRESASRHTLQKYGPARDFIAQMFRPPPPVFS